MFRFGCFIWKWLRKDNFKSVSLFSLLSESVAVEVEEKKDVKYQHYKRKGRNHSNLLHSQSELSWTKRWTEWKTQQLHITKDSFIKLTSAKLNLLNAKLTVTLAFSASTSYKFQQSKGAQRRVKKTTRTDFYTVLCFYLLCELRDVTQSESIIF